MKGTTMATRDVELVVRAKDDSSKTLDTIAKALDDLASGITNTGKMVEKGETSFSKLGKALGALDKAFKGVSSSERMAQQVDRATKATDGLEKQLHETQAEVEKLARSMSDAEAATRGYSTRLDESGKSLDREKKKLKEAQQAHKELNTDLREATLARAKLETAEKSLTATLGQQQDRLKKYEDRIAGLKKAMDETDKPTKRLENSLRTATEAAAKVAGQITQTDTALTAARTGLVAAAQAEKDFAAVVGLSVAEIAQQRDAIKRAAQEKQENAKLTREAVAAEGQLGRQFRATAAALTQQQTGYGRAAQSLTELQQNAARTEQSMAQLAQAAKGPLNDAYRAQQSIVSNINNAYQANRKELAALSALMGAVGVPTREMAEAMNRLNAVSRQVQTAHKQESQALKELGQSMRTSATDSDQLLAKQRQFASTVANGARALQQSTESTNRAAVASQRLTAEAKRQAQAYEQQGASLRDIAGAKDREAAATDKASQAYIRNANASRQAMTFTQRLRGEVLSLISAYGGIYAVINVLNQTVEAYKTLEAVQSRLAAVNKGDQRKTAEDLDFVRRNADRLGIQMGVLANEYSKFAASTENTAIAGKATKDIFLSVAEAGRVTKLSLDDMGGVFKALTQIASKGKFQLEELSGQLGDRLPGALQILADGMGITVKELLALTKEGKVASDNLKNFAQELDKRYGGQLEKSLETTTTALGRLGNAVFEALLRFGNNGFLEGFTELVIKLTEVLRSADFERFAGKVSAAFGIMAKALAFATENWQLFTAAAVGLAALKITPTIIGWVSDLGKLRGATSAAATGVNAAAASASALPGMFGGAARAAGGLSMALRGLLVSSGWGIAVAAIAAGFSLWASKADEASKSLEAHRQIVDKVKAGYDAARGAVTDWAKEIKTVSTTEALLNAENTLKAYRTQIKGATLDFRALFADAALTRSQGGIPAFATTIDQLEELTKKFETQEISLDDYKAALDKIAQDSSLPDFLRDLVASTITGSEETRGAADSWKQAQLILKIYTGTAEEAKAAMDELMGITKDNADATGKATGPTEEFTAAMEEMTGVIDKANGSLKELKERLKLEEAFAAAAGAARSMGELNAALDRYNRGLSAIDAKDLDSIIGGAKDGFEASKSLIRDRESFRPDAYWDVNAWRTGYGSDTVTLDNGSVEKVTQATRTTVEQANKDLDRRTREFMSTVIKQVGPERFNSFSPAQQASLTSIAYNYGSLPERIVGAVRSGTNGEIKQAIQNLGGDNKGVNRGRRNMEAQAFGEEKVTIERQEKFYEKKEEDRQKDKAQTAERIAGQQQDIANQQLINDGKAREAAMEKAKQDALKENKDISKEELALIAEQAGKLYDLNQAKKESKQESQAAKQAEQEVNALLAQRAALQTQLKQQIKAGDTEGAEATKAEIENLNTKLTEAIENAKQLWQSLGGEAAGAAITRLETASIKAENLSRQAQSTKFNWQQVGDLFANGLVNAFDSFARAVAEGKSIGEAARDAFLQFAGDFLVEIGKMILKQALFNLLRSFGGPFANLGGFGAGHSGGTIGSSRVGSGNPTRSVNPMVFSGAQRFHTGGLPGLRPNEVPIIAKKNEEVLSENDPRNILNGGASAHPQGGGSAPAPQIRIVNAFDSADVVSQGLASGPGEETLLNVVRSNASTIRSILETS